MTKAGGFLKSILGGHEGFTKEFNEVAKPSQHVELNVGTWKRYAQRD